MIKKYFLLTIIIFVCFCNWSYGKSNSSPLTVTIESDKETYKSGDTIELSHTIKNISTESVGFYVENRGNIELEAFDNSGNILKYYHHVSWQRMMPSLYPNEYVFLQPNQTWERKEKFPLQLGEITDFRQARSKLSPGKPTVIYGGFYINLPFYMTHDHILIPNNSGVKIKLALKFSANNPNPRNFTPQNCKASNIPLDLFPEELSSNKISSGTVKCAGGSCPDLNINYDNLENLPDPRFIEETRNLAIYCQHKTALSRDAWLGTLESNTITIKIKK